MSFCYLGEVLGLSVRKYSRKGAENLLRTKILFKDLKLKERRELDVGRPTMGHTENNRSLFSMEGDEYSLSRVRFQKEQGEPSWSLGLLHPHMDQRRFFDYIWFSLELPWTGGGGVGWEGFLKLCWR